MYGSGFWGEDKKGVALALSDGSGADKVLAFGEGGPRH